MLKLYTRTFMTEKRCCRSAYRVSTDCSFVLSAWMYSLSFSMSASRPVELSVCCESPAVHTAESASSIFHTETVNLQTRGNLEQAALALKRLAGWRRARRGGTTCREELPSGRRGETAYLLLARRERTPPNLTPCQQCLNEVLPRVAKDKIPRDITTSALRNRADKTELFI